MPFAGTEHPGCASGGNDADEVASDIEAEVSLPDPNRNALLISVPSHTQPVPVREIKRPVYELVPVNDLRDLAKYPEWLRTNTDKVGKAKARMHLYVEAVNRMSGNSSEVLFADIGV